MFLLSTDFLFKLELHTYIYQNKTNTVHSRIFIKGIDNRIFGATPQIYFCPLNYIDIASKKEVFYSFVVRIISEGNH